MSAKCHVRSRYQEEEPRYTTFSAFTRPARSSLTAQGRSTSLAGRLRSRACAELRLAAGWMKPPKRSLALFFGVAIAVQPQRRRVQGRNSGGKGGPARTGREKVPEPLPAPATG